MATELYAANLAATTVSSGGTTAPASGTTETWTVASSAMFGAAATSVSQFHVADPAAPSEVIAVTNVSGTTWTVTRGAESTIPVAHAAGFTIYQVATTGFLGTALTTASLAIPGSLSASSSSAPPMTYQALGGGHSAKLQGWFAALANRDYARANVVIIGDSITEGYGATSGSNRYPALLATALRSRFPTAGVTGGGRGFLAPQLAAPGTWVPDWVTVTGTLGQDYNSGPNAVTWDISAGGGCTLTYSLVGDAADIMYVTASGFGSFRYKVDSGGFTTVSTDAAFVDGNITHVSLGSAGSHTLTIQWLSGGSVLIDGVVEYNGDYSAGIQVHDAGQTGASTIQFIAAGHQQYPAAVAALNPGLVIIELGVNDRSQGDSPAQYAANMNTIIGLLRGAQTNTGSATYTNPPYYPPILLLGVWPAGTTTASQWAPYLAAMYSIAAGDPLIDVLDLSLRFPAPNVGGNTWNLFYDTTHPDNNGHSMIADALCSFLSPA